MEDRHHCELEEAEERYRQRRKAGAEDDDYDGNACDKCIGWRTQARKGR